MPHGTSSSKGHDLLRVALTLAAVVLLVPALLIPASAFASITMVDTQAKRTIAVHTPTTMFQYYISRADCEGKDAFQFPYTVADVNGQQIEVWATTNGADCKLEDKRSGTGAICTRVNATVEQPKINGDIITISSFALAHISETTSDSSCEPALDTGSAPQDLAIYFLLKQGGASGDVPPENAFAFNLAKIDLRGPTAPTEVSATGVENGLSLKYTLSTSNDVAGYFIFCDPKAESGTGGAGGNGGSGGSASTSATQCLDVMASMSSSTSTTSTTSTAASTSTSTVASSSASTTAATTSSGAGGGGMGGGGGATSSSAATSATSTAAVTSSAAVTTAAATSTDASTSTGGSTECVDSVVLIPGQIPPCAYVCGSVGPSGGGLAENLLNDSKYVVGVAGYDFVGNVGPLSEVTCETPIEVDDFFELYKDAGGTGGGCGCNLANRTDALGAGGLMGLAVYAAAARRRRRRTR